MKGYDEVLEALEQDEIVELTSEYMKMTVADEDVQMVTDLIEEKGGVVNEVSPHGAGVGIVFEMEKEE